MTITKTNDEKTVFYFNERGRVVKAIDHQYGTTFEYKFVLVNGRLSAIQQKTAGQPFAPWYAVKYDQQKKNVTEEKIGSNISVMYFFNATKKVKGQYLADQLFGDSYFFLALVKYLNLFPELHSQNLVVASQTLNTEYPGNYSTVYTNHQFDGSGRINSYTAALQLEGSSGPYETGVWNFNSNCLK